MDAESQAAHAAKVEMVRRRIHNTKRVRRFAKMCAVPVVAAIEYVGFRLLDVPTSLRKAWRETKYELRLENRPFDPPPRYDAEYFKGMEILDKMR